MDADGVISRHVFADVTPRAEHEVTERGRSLKPIIGAMREWGKDFKAMRLFEERQVLEIKSGCA